MKGKIINADLFNMKVNPASDLMRPHWVVQV